MRADYQTLVQKAQEIADLEHAAALLMWDQETYLPEGGAAQRARQLATLSGIAHSRFTDPELGHLLAELRAQDLPDETQRLNVLRLGEDLDRELKLDTAFVERRSMLISQAYQAWIEARKANDFQRFAPTLGKLVELKLEEADRLGYQDHPYDAMLESYEPGLRTAEVSRLFEDFENQIGPLVRRIRAQAQPDTAFLHKHYPKDRQWAFGLEVLGSMGYDFKRGRQDLSEHPFTISFGAEDVRVTTRVDESDFSNMLWSCIHEGGHALYEQGLPADQYGLPLGRAASLAIHESQSRLWENHVGRGHAFWTHWFPRLKEAFPAQLAEIGLDEFYPAINRIAPNLIRTEADELHYHYHVLIRFQLEKGLLDKSIRVDELSALWNERYLQYLGIGPADHRSGILQDVHWSHGSFGYFPTYSLGSFYAAQFYETAQAQIPGLEEQLASGDSSALLQWLRTHIHRHGRAHKAAELCKLVSGKALDLGAFARHISTKYLVQEA